MTDGIQFTFGRIMMNEGCAESSRTLNCALNKQLTRIECLSLPRKSFTRCRIIVL